MVFTPEKIARTLPSSHFPMTYLSLASQKVRIRRLQTERKNLAQTMKKCNHLSVSLGSEQSADLSNIVNIINHDQCIRSELDERLTNTKKDKDRFFKIFGMATALKQMKSHSMLTKRRTVSSLQCTTMHYIKLSISKRRNRSSHQQVESHHILACSGSIHSFSCSLSSFKEL